MLPTHRTLQKPFQVHWSCFVYNCDIFITGYYFLDQGTCIMQSFVLSYSNLLYRYVFSKLLELAITTRHLCEHQNHWLGRGDNIYGI